MSSSFSTGKCVPGCRGAGCRVPARACAEVLAPIADPSRRMKRKEKKQKPFVLAAATSHSAEIPAFPRRSSEVFPLVLSQLRVRPVGILDVHVVDLRRPAHIGLRDHGIAQHGVVQARELQVGLVQRGSREVGEAEVGVEEGRRLQVGRAEVGVAHEALLERHALQVLPREVRAVQGGAPRDGLHGARVEALRGRRALGDLRRARRCHAARVCTGNLQLRRRAQRQDGGGDGGHAQLA
eukprot:scaffold878_cov271-Pinguiococcus_pyrenoidosus.AAC.70